MFYGIITKVFVYNLTLSAYFIGKQNISPSEKLPLSISPPNFRWLYNSLVVNLSLIHI